MKKNHKLRIVKANIEPHPRSAEIKEKILSELDIDRASTHTEESPLFETLASLTFTKVSNQG